MTNKLILAALLVPALAAADTKDYDNFVGSWKGAGKMTMGKDVAKVDLKIECKRTAADAAVACTMHAGNVPGLGNYEESDLFGFEPNTSTYHWYAVTNAGEVHDHTTKSLGAKSQWVFEGTQEGKPLKETIDMSFSKDTMSFKSVVTVGGTQVAMLEGEVKK